MERHGHGSTEETALDPSERAREALLMGLRLSEGIDAVRFAARTGMALDDALDPATLARALEEGYLSRAGSRLRATPEGRKRLDALLVALVR